MEKVKAQWDSTQHGVEVRQQQLRRMLSDSVKWDDQKQEMEKLIGKYETYLHAFLQSPKEMLIKQISENKVSSESDIPSNLTPVCQVCNSSFIFSICLRAFICAGKNWYSLPGILDKIVRRPHFHKSFLHIEAEHSLKKQ